MFHGLMNGEHYDIAEDFDPKWGVSGLFWCRGGQEEYRLANGRTIRLKAGTVLALGRHERYSFKSKCARPYLSSMIIFPRSMTNQLINGDSFETHNNTSSGASISTGVFKPPTQLMARLASVVGRNYKSPDWYDERAVLILSMLLEQQGIERQRFSNLRSRKVSTKKNLMHRLERALELMHAEYNDSTLSLASIASEACIARYHFSRVFADAYGVTPTRYLRELRMAAAVSLLEAGYGPMDTVAMMVGFKNRAAFHRCFKKEMGNSPARYHSSPTSLRSSKL